MLKLSSLLSLLLWMSGAVLAQSLSTKETLHYEPWFVKQGLVEQAADATLAGDYKPYAYSEPWKFSVPIDWNARGATNNWDSVLQSLYIIDPLALQYEATGDRRYLDNAMAIVRDWHRFHIAEGQEARFSWSDAPTGIRSMKLAWLYSQSLAEEDKVLLRDLAQLHVTKVLDGSVEFRMTNHGIFQIHGIVALCHVVQMPSCIDARVFVAEKLHALLQEQFDDEAIHVEHSIGYHRLAINQFEFFVNSGLYEEFPELEDVIGRAKQSLFWLADPNDELWQIGDTNLGAIPRKWKATYPDIKCDPACLRVFDYGYVSIKSEPGTDPQGASGLFVQGAFHSLIHKQHDDLSFELYELGQKLLTDSGAVGYERSERRRYVQSSRAHNTVEIGQKEFNRRNPPYGSAIKIAEQRGEHFFIEAEAPHPHLGAIHHREFRYWPGQKLAVTDRVKFSGTPEPVAQWFHFHPDVAFVERSGSRIEMLLGDHAIILENRNGCPSTVRKGRTKPRWDGWSSPSTGTIEPRYAIAFICTESEAIETILSFGASSQQQN